MTEMRPKWLKKQKLSIFMFFDLRPECHEITQTIDNW